MSVLTEKDAAYTQARHSDFYFFTFLLFIVICLFSFYFFYVCVEGDLWHLVELCKVNVFDEVRLSVKVSKRRV